MIIDIAKQIGAISREVARQHTESGETVALTQRRYDDLLAVTVIASRCRSGRRLAGHHRP